MTQENPVQITFHQLPRSAALEDEIRAQVEHLKHFHDHLHGCEVIVEPDGKHKQTGQRARVGIRLHVPGRTLVVGRHPARPGHEDPTVAIHDAFQALGRQLQDYIRQRRHQVKPHFDVTTHGRVIQLAEDHGFVESFEGREVYFHRNSLVNADFEDLAVGTEVRFHEEPGEQGPQASSVTRVGRGVD